MYIPIESKELDELKDCECGYCNLKIKKYDIRGNIRRFVSGHNSKGINNYNFKGRVKDGKYFKVYRPDHPQAQGKGYVREHRLVYEEYYNCCLLPWILIHHINGDTTDNRIENLEPMTKPNHQILHLTIDKSNRHCLLCPKTSSRKWYEYLDGFKCHSCYMKEYHKKRKG